MPARSRRRTVTSRARSGLGVALAALGVVAAFRLPFICLPRFFDSDDAVNGLMALAIQRGEFPLYYWGQGYLNTITPAVAAVFLWLFPCGQFAVKLSSLLLHLGSAWIIAWLILRATGSRLAAVGALVLTALLPLPLAGMTLGVGSPAARNLTILCGLACWGLSLSGRRVLPALALGLLAGIGYWNEPSILLFVLPVAVFALGEWGGRAGGAAERRLLKWGAAAGAGFLVGVAPHLYGLSRDLVTFRPGAAFLQIVEAGPRLKALLIEALPPLLSAGVPSSLALATSIVVLILLVTLIVLAHVAAYSRGAGKVKELVLLSDLLAIGFGLAWIVGPAGGGSGRYVILLTPAFLIWSVIGFLRLAKSRPHLAPAVPALYCLALMISVPAYWKQSESWKVDTTPALALLKGEGLKGAFANYWAANLLTLRTRENVIVAQSTGVPLRHGHYYGKLARMDRVGYLFNPKRFPEDAKLFDWTAKELKKAGKKFSFKWRGSWILIAPEARGLSMKTVDDLRLRPGREELKRKIEELEAQRNLRKASRISR